MSEELSPSDHRRLGRELNLFHFQEEAAGSVFWHVDGWTLYKTIEDYIRGRLKDSGYGEVRTPQLFERSMWEKSGHWENYGDAMFSTGDREKSVCSRSFKLTETVNPTHILKPMNCPAHIQIFNSNNVSYKQLPIRIAEFGCCHRNEPSGSLHGIMRVRQFVQDDAHIFCMEDQIEEETKNFCDLLMSVYRDFGFTDISVGFSTRPEKRAGSDEVWDQAESSLMKAVEAAGLTYDLQEGEGAFYGPKLEFALTDNKGRKWQCGTIQLDFVLPDRLGARYVSQDGKLATPVMLHRAILGSLERFIGILLEHYEGRLPIWLAPTQAVITSVKPDADDYAKKVYENLLQQGVRVKLDLRNENLKQKIKEHSNMAVPYIFVVGKKEEEDQTVSVRRLGSNTNSISSFTALPLLFQHSHLGMDENQ